MKKTKSNAEARLQPEYRREGLGKGVRGKYLAAYQRGSNRVLRNPDIAKAFPTSEAVNQALGALLSLTDQTTKLTRRSKPRSAKRATHPEGYQGRAAALLERGGPGRKRRVGN